MWTTIAYSTFYIQYFLLPWVTLQRSYALTAPDRHSFEGTDRLMISERWPYLEKRIHQEKAISVLSSTEELRYIISSMFHLDKVKQVLTGFPSYQVLADTLNDEVKGLCMRGKRKRGKKRNWQTYKPLDQWNYQIWLFLGFLSKAAETSYYTDRCNNAIYIIMHYILCIICNIYYILYIKYIVIIIMQ